MLEKYLEGLKKALPVGEIWGDYEDDYYCNNCFLELKHEHQEKCSRCDQLQQW